VNSVQVNLDRCVIRSPIDGIVIDKKVELGQTVAASFQTPVLFVLAKNLENMEVKASVDEADIGKVREGQPVSFTVDAFPDDKFEGSIEQVRTSPKIEQNVVTYQVIIRTDNKKLKLKPGMTANINITVEEKKDVLKIPNSALRFRPDRVAGFPMPEEKNKETANKETNNQNESSNPERTGQRRGNNTQARAGGREGNRGSGRPAGGEGREKGGRRGNGNLATIWILEDGKPREVKFEPGISDFTFTEMKSGELTEGMTIITNASSTGKKSVTPQGGQQGVRVRF
jgi:HlyD family secretion protein